MYIIEYNNLEFIVDLSMSWNMFIETKVDFKFGRSFFDVTKKIIIISIYLLCVYMCNNFLMLDYGLSD